MYVPRLIAWEVTRTCMMNCKHCRADSNNKKYNEELEMYEIKKIIDNIANYYSPIIILTGGDPMMRSDIFEISSYGTSKGLKMVIAPCGNLLTKDTVIKLKKSGIQRVSFSIDGDNYLTHDEFRGVKNSFKTILKAIELIKKIGIPFQINSTITKHNILELPGILQLAINLGAVSFHPFLLVPTGKAKKMIDFELSPQQYENTLNWFYKQMLESEMQIKPTCVPHFIRILKQNAKPANNKNMFKISRGCLGGESFSFISYNGDIQICGFLDINCGNLRQNNYDFNHIWNNSEIIQNIRNKKNYKGKCGNCEYLDSCSGCRARAYGITGDYLAEEPYCNYIPKKLEDKNYDN